MSRLLHWLEQRAAEWIESGERRVPVRTQGNVGWGISGNLATNDSINDAVQLQVGFGAQMQTHTIQFDGPDNNIDFGASVVPTPEAEILWQVNGIVIRRLVTVQDGLSVSGEAQSVTVNVRDRTLGGGGQAYRVAMTVAPGPRGNIQQPPSLQPRGVTAAGTEFQYRVSVVAGSFVNWIIPPNCGAVSTYLGLMVPTGEVVENVRLEYRGANLIIYQLLDGNCRFKWVPLPQGIERITLRNNTGNTVNASLLIGIDG